MMSKGERYSVPFSVGFALVAWETVHFLGIVPDKYFPSILTIAAAFWQMLEDGQLLRGEALTFSRAFIGLIGAAALGILLAIVSDLSPVFGRGFRYISDAVQPIPPAAVVPMAVFSLGLGLKLYAFIIILVTVWPTYVNGAAALAAVSPVQINAGRSFGYGKLEILRHVKLPAAMPEIFSGIRYAATIALIAVIVSEMLAGRDGLGFMIFKKSFANRTPDVFALMFAVALTGVALNAVVGLLRNLMIGWHQQMSGRHL